MQRIGHERNMHNVGLAYRYFFIRTLESNFSKEIVLSKQYQYHDHRNVYQLISMYTIMYKSSYYQK